MPGVWYCRSVADKTKNNTNIARQTQDAILIRE
jgi:hypothetical protein